MIFEAMDLYRTLDLKSNPRNSSHFQMNFKRTINCPATRANMNEPSKQTTDRRYYCSVMYVTQQWRSYHKNFSSIITQLTSHSNNNAGQNESKWKFQWHKR